MTLPAKNRVTNASQWDEWGSDHELTLTFPRRGSCYVYVAWGSDRSRPLYVGKARNPYDRIATHMRQKPWIGDVVEWECRGFPDERTAEYAEIEAIAALNPIHNVIRRMTQAQWAEIRRASRAKEAAQRRVAAEWRAARQAPAPKPEPVYRRKPLRRVKWRDDVFTPDQLDIIARVQNRGRAA